jgi:uncharacterized membrane protein
MLAGATEAVGTLSSPRQALEAVASAIGHAVCAQNPLHSAWLGDPPAALCLRCSGMHLTLALAAAALAAAGAWRVGGGARRLALMGAALLAPMAVDVGLIRLGLRGGDAATRLVTGALGGAGAALLLTAVLRLAVRSPPSPAPTRAAVAAALAAGATVAYLLAAATRAWALAFDLAGAAAVVANLALVGFTVARSVRGRAARSDMILGLAVSVAVLAAMVWWRPSS